MVSVSFFCTARNINHVTTAHWIASQSPTNNNPCRSNQSNTILISLKTNPLTEFVFSEISVFFYCKNNAFMYVSLLPNWGGWGCEVSCGGHHRPRGKTTTGSALDGAVFDIAQILAYLVHNMSRSQLYLGFGHFGWLPSFFWSITFWRAYG